MISKKKLSIFITSATALTILVQGSSYAAKKNQNDIEIATSIINQTIALTTNTTGVEDPNEQVVITCKDYNLYKKLKSEIEAQVVKYDDTNFQITITRANLNTVTELNLSNSDIVDLTGIENFTNLSQLVLSKNSISDISKLSGLVNLNTLDLSNMKNKSLKDITPLSNLINLVTLNIGENDISNIDSLRTLINLEVLNLSNNSISSASVVKNLNNLKSIDISKNSSFSNLEDILAPKLEVLRAHSTSITNIEYISRSSELKEIDLHNNRIETLEHLFKTMEVEGKDVIILSKIEKLNLGTTTKKGISYSKLKDMPLLTYLDFSNNEMSSISGIINLEKLEYLNLDRNGIQDIEGFVKIKKEGDNVIIEKAISATQISLMYNDIQDISVFKDINSFNKENERNSITNLYLDGNKIHQIGAIESLKGTAEVSLRNQTINMGIYQNKTDENYYVILLDIMQAAKSSNSIAYDKDAKFIMKGVTLNTNEIYNKSPYYNIIITPEKTKNDTLSVTLNGGIASGTTINFTLSTSTAGTIETILFEDENLESAIYSELCNKREEKEYIAKIPKIINVLRSIVTDIDQLNLQNKKIEKLKGLESFTELEKLELQNNIIKDDSKIAYLTKLKELNLANNKLNNNYAAIENLYLLEVLKLSGNSIEDLNSIDKLIQNIADKKKKIKLVNLSLGSNNLEDEDINILNKITILTDLDISGNEITDIRPIIVNENLNTLNISKNKIKDISCLDKLINLKNLYMANNIIEDINPIKNLALDNLDISANRISDISAVKNMNLKKIEMQDNKIEDVSPIEGKLIIDGVSAEKQKISYILEENQSGNITIPLPEIFKSSKNSSSKVYSSKQFKLNRCILSEDENSIIVNVEQLGNNVATIAIQDGVASGTQFSVGERIQTTIDYNIKELTNKDVVATIKFNVNEADRNVRVINNNGEKTYTFTKNGEFTFEFEDDYGFSGTATAKVNWIDKVAPKVEGVEEGKTYTQPVKTIITDENLDTIELTKDGVIVENYKNEDTISDEGQYKLTVADKAGNKTEVNFIIKVESNTLEVSLKQNSTFKIDEEKRYIENINPNTEIQTVISSIETNGEIKVYKGTTPITNKETEIGTGMTIEVSKGTEKRIYTVIVKGDCNGSGTTSVSDLTKLMMSRAESLATNKDETKILKGVYEKAVDLNEDGKISIGDITKLSIFIADNK